MNDVELQRVRRLLSGSNPVPDRVLERAHERPAAREAYLRIVATAPDRSAGPVPNLRRGVPVPARVGLGAAAAAALVLVSVLVDPWNLDPDAVAQTPPLLSYDLVVQAGFVDAVGDEAQPVLRNLADAATVRVDPPAAGDVQYVHVAQWMYRSTTDADGIAASIVPSTVDSWVWPDGSVRRTERSGEPLLVGGQLPDVGALATGEPVTEEFGPGSSDAAAVTELASLPPEEVRDRVLDGTACATGEASDDAIAVCLLEGAARLHELAVVPGSVDAAVWTVLAEDSRLVTLGGVRDRAGRRAVAVTSGPTVPVVVRPVLLIDAADGSLLGVERVLLDSDAGYGVPVPAVVGFQAYIARARVAPPG
jgi:hypothetical protein